MPTHHMKLRLVVLLGVSAAFSLPGCSAKRDGKTPQIFGVDPAIIITAFAPAKILIAGSGFSPSVDDALTDEPRVVMPQVSLLGPGGTAYSIPQENVSLPADDLSGDRLVVLVPQQLAPPTASGQPDVVYGIEVANPNGNKATLADALTISAPREIGLVGVDPPFACTSTPTQITILGSVGFVSTPQVELRSAGDTNATSVSLTRVAFVDASTLTAVVPAGIAVGSYDVTVVNPPTDGGVGALSDGIRIVALPVPNVIAITPGRGDTQSDTPVTIVGENFRDPVAVDILDATESVVSTGLSPAVGSGNQITTTLQNNTDGLASDAYLVRVTNTDEQTYFTYAAFLVTNPSANPNGLEADSPLLTGRRMLCGAAAKDDLGNRFVYAIGGDTGDGGDVLASVEVAQLSRFGDLGDWREQQNSLVTPRVGAAAVAVPVFGTSPYVPTKTYIYVFGGKDDQDNVLDTIERAIVLPAAQAPEVADAVVGTTNGGLAAGTWYYVVAAVLSSGDADNPNGETLASDEAIVTTAQNNSTVTLSWSAMSGAASYKIYRTPEVDLRSGGEVLLAEDITDTSFTDDGQGTPGTVAPLAPGATGVFVATGTMASPRWGHQAVVTNDAGGSRYVVLIGGLSTGDAFLDGSEVSALDASDGSLATFADAQRAFSLTSRAFFSAVVANKGNVNAFPNDDSRIYVFGGMAGSNITTTVEAAEFSATNGPAGSPGIDAWYDAATDIQNRAAGTMAILFANKVFVLGGAGVTAGAFGNVISQGRDAQFDGSGDLGALTSIGAGGGFVQGAKALGIAVEQSGFFYFIGGTSDGTNASTTTERTF